MSAGYGVMKRRVMDTHAANPTWGATQIAHALGCHDAYVRAACSRMGVKLPRSPYGIVPSRGAEYNRQHKAPAKRTRPAEQVAGV